MKLPERIAWWVLIKIPLGAVALAGWAALIWIVFEAHGLPGLAVLLLGSAWLIGIIVLTVRQDARARGDLVDD